MARFSLRFNTRLKFIKGVLFTVLNLIAFTGEVYSWNSVKCSCACDSSNIDECAPKCSTECKKSKCAAKFQERDDVQKAAEEKKRSIEEKERNASRVADAERMRNERYEAASNYDARRREEAIRREGKKVIDAREKEMAARGRF
jgi:hypothetical protein